MFRCLTSDLFASQLCAAGPIFTFQFFVSVCSLVRLSQSGEAWERVSGGQLARFELAGLFTSSLRKASDASTIDNQQ